MPREPARYTLADWQAEARRRFGDDAKDWAFVCPACGHIAWARDWQEAGAPEGAMAFSCVGRWWANPQSGFVPKGKRPPRPCNYAGGGLFRLNPVIVTDDEGREHQMFDFAPVRAAMAQAPPSGEGG